MGSDHGFKPSAVPGECAELMKQMHSAAHLGEYERCLDLQRKTNECLKKHGYSVYVLPEEYFRLLHDSTQKSVLRNPEQLRLIYSRMEELKVNAGMESVPAESVPADLDLPPEYFEYMKLAGQALEKQDLEEFRRLSQKGNSILHSLGIVNTLSIID